MSDFSDNGFCFVCGPRNPIGLHLNFKAEEPGSVTSAVSFPETLQGWQGVVHGGLLTTVLDETLIKAAWSKNLTCVTVEITMSFKKPAQTGERYLISGRVGEVRGKIVLAESELRDGRGNLIASARGKLFCVA